MPWLSIAVIVYGIAVAAGGAMGFIMKGSVPSLISGGVSGLIILAMGIYSKSNPRVGFLVTTIMALALIAFFVWRYVSTPAAERSMVPFQVIGLSTVMLVLLIVGHFMKSGATNP